MKKNIFFCLLITLAGCGEVSVDGDISSEKDSGETNQIPPVCEDDLCNVQSTEKKCAEPELTCIEGILKVVCEDGSVLEEDLCQCEGESTKCKTASGLKSECEINKFTLQCIGTESGFSLAVTCNGDGNALNSLKPCKYGCDTTLFDQASCYECNGSDGCANGLKCEAHRCVPVTTEPVLEPDPKPCTSENEFEFYCDETTGRMRRKCTTDNHEIESSIDCPCAIINDVPVCVQCNNNIKCTDNMNCYQNKCVIDLSGYETKCVNKEYYCGIDEITNKSSLTIKCLDDDRFIDSISCLCYEDDKTDASCVQCLEDSDCGDIHLGCVEHRCVIKDRECDSNKDCLDNSVCNFGVCVTATCGLDGSTYNICNIHDLDQYKKMDLNTIESLIFHGTLDCDDTCEDIPVHENLKVIAGVDGGTIEGHDYLSHPLFQNIYGKNDDKLTIENLRLINLRFMGDIQGAFSNSVSNARFVNVTISNLTVLSDSATEMQGAFIGEGLNVDFGDTEDKGLIVNGIYLLNLNSIKVVGSILGFANTITFQNSSLHDVYVYANNSELVGGVVGDLTGDSFFADLYLTNSNVFGKKNVAGIIGHFYSNNQLSFKNVINEFNFIQATVSHAAGLVAYTDEGAKILIDDLINRCFQSSSCVDSKNQGGGLLGWMHFPRTFELNNTINEVCCIKSNSNNYLGGFLGYLETNAISENLSINNVISKVILEGVADSKLGGFIGGLNLSNYTSIMKISNVLSNSFITIPTRSNVGGFLYEIISAFSKTDSNSRVNFMNIVSSSDVVVSSEPTYHTDTNALGVKIDDYLNGCASYRDNPNSDDKVKRRAAIKSIFYNVFYSTLGYANANGLNDMFCNTSAVCNNIDANIAAYKNYLRPFITCWFTDYVTDSGDNKTPVLPYFPYSCSASSPNNCGFNCTGGNCTEINPIQNNMESVLKSLNDSSLNPTHTKWFACDSISKFNFFDPSEYHYLLCPILTGAKYTCMKSGGCAE